ncbi:MAG: MFS transporter [Actinomycetota bacterium]
MMAVATATLTGPGQTIGVAVFIDRFVEDLGLSRSQVSTAYLVGTLSGAVLLPRVGRAVDRHGVRAAQMVIAVAFAAALVNMSLVTGGLWLAIGFTGIRFLGQGSLSLVATVTVSVRFVRNRGTALGIFATASGALMALVPLVLAVAIELTGWRGAWRLAALVIVVTVLPIAAFGYRGLPSGAELAAGRRSVGPTSSGAGGDPAGPVFDRRQAMATPQFWMLAATSSAAGMLVTGLNFHQIDLLGEAGLSATAAAALFIPQVAGSTIAGLAVGYLSDRTGTRYLPAVAMVLLVVAHLLAAVVAPGLLVLFYSVTLGAMGGTIRTTIAIVLPDWFGVAHLGSIQGSLNLFGVGASALGPVALAVVQEWFGAYRPAVLALSAIGVAVLVLALQPWATGAPGSPQAVSPTTT